MGSARTLRAALVPAAGIALMGVMGIIHAAGGGLDAFDLDREYTVPAIYSTGLLLVAAGFALAAARGRNGAERNAFRVVAALLAFVALDELVSLHERLYARVDVDWQLLYLPVAVCFGWAAWRVVTSLGRGSRSVRLLYAGVAAWVVSQLLELFAFRDLTPGLVDTDGTAAEIHETTHSLAFYLMSIPEELLEMTGSLLLALAFAVAVRRGADAPH